MEAKKNEKCRLEIDPNVAIKHISFFDDVLLFFQGNMDEDV